MIQTLWMEILNAHTVSCPYCGEPFETTIDASAGNQQYIEDCYVCCRPIQFVVNIDYQGKLVAVETRRDDE